MTSTIARATADSLPSSQSLEESALREAVDLKATLSLAKSVIANHPWSESTVREFDSVIRGIEERAADKQLYLAIVGEFSVGKSSFINALLRENLLLSDVLQGTTAAPTIIRRQRFNWWDRMLNFFGVKPPRTLTIRFKGGTEETRRYRSAGAFKAALHGSANEESRAAKIEKIIVGHTADSLADGLVIIDTPGLNSDNGRHSEVVTSVVNELADGFVILTSAEPPLPNSLLEFLHRHLTDSVARSALVVTKMDLIPADQRDRHLSYIQTRFRREFSLDNSLVLAISPKFVVAEKASASAVEWTKSFHEAEALLKNFLRLQRTAILAERTAKLLSRMLKALHSELSALDGHFRGRQTALEQSRPSDEQAFFNEKRADYTKATEFNHILTNFSPIAKNREKMSSMPQTGEIDLLIATDCISEGQNLQDCDYLINYDIHWNPVRIIQRFGRIDRLKSRNHSVQLVNFWPTDDLNNYINLKHRVEARMALVDLAATFEDNVLKADDLEELIQDDLKYRDKQLLRLKDEILDMDELNEDGISLSEFTLDDFRIDLLKYLEANRAALQSAPFGLYTVVPPDPEFRVIAPGVVFCFKQTGKTQGSETVNPLQPYFLVYIRDDGNVRFTFAQPKQTLDIYRILCAGKSTPNDALCTLFDEQTSHGRDMAAYSDLLQKAIASVVHTFSRRAVGQLLLSRDAILPTRQEQATEDSEFDLVTWLVIKEAKA